MAKLLGGSAGSFFSRCLGSINHPPTLLSPDPELHIVYEYMSGQRGAHGLVQAHGPLRSAPLTYVLRSWGRQLLLALGGSEVRAAPATPGVGTAIDNAVVHSVSCVTAGVRHTLLAVFDDE